ncbi:uncharacterized protein LOC111002229 [Pieris rapae]|uniref:uncharacterized protein LOC111002229 n=1 Tax=Pieris rapae TaxID=64459 RepID=UPI001E280C8E|nr:uncharacterized protein LOC111002229 [Pieris rapae]
MEELKKSLTDVSVMVSTKMDEFQQRLLAAQERSPSLEQTPLTREFEAFKSSVLFCLKNLQGQMEILFKVQEEQEMRSRRKCLLLHGINETKDENPGTIANMLSVLLKCPNISEASFSRCHRMGIRRDGKPRPVLIKLREHCDKDKIWLAKTELKGTGITLSEFLTKTRHNLFMAARRRFGVSKCWTRNGHIFVIDANGERRRVNSIKDVDAAPASTPPSTTDTKAASPNLKSRNRKITKN